MKSYTVPYDLRNLQIVTNNNYQKISSQQFQYFIKTKKKLTRRDVTIDQSYVHRKAAENTWNLYPPKFVLVICFNSARAKILNF